jgi:protocatechuate 3,4-dioxygenase beta subunit
VRLNRLVESNTPLASIDRRQFLRVGGGAALGLVLVACSDEAPVTTGPPTDTVASAPEPVLAEATTTSAATAATDPSATGPLAALTAADFDGLGTCGLTPEKTAGPFPLDEQFDRRDVTEGVPGHPMRLGLRVVDASCGPVPGASVEIWHCDATGDYSAFQDGGGGKDEGAGSTFLRGTQTAGDDGIVDFQTIVPGWYRGRAVHIHLRVHRDGRTVLTSQLFFDPGLLEEVYAVAPYAEFGMPDTSNEDDNIAGNAEAEGTIVHTAPGATWSGTGTVALLNLGVDA